MDLKYNLNTTLKITWDNSNIIEMCLETSTVVPRFCFHEQLACAGNCRMCLIEIEKTYKPLTSCSAPVTNLLTLYTETPFVFKAREGVLEMVLTQHPLDCPVCDQGGECDLQEEVFYFGSDRGRFFFIKRGVHDENWSLFVKSVMVRCIHCTRCVRFLRDITGTFTLGVLARGNDSLISLFRNGEMQVQNKAIFETEFFGNVVDLCPVGALTTKMFSFVARPWELRSIVTVDIMETVGNLIRIDFKGSEITRVMSFKNETNIFDWVSDCVRFGYDSYRFQRIFYPLYRAPQGFVPFKWFDLLQRMEHSLVQTNPREIQFIYDMDNINCERIGDLNTLAQMYGIYCSSNDLILNSFLQHQYHYQKGFNLSGLLKTDLVLFCSVNVRYEVPLLNLVLRKLYLENNLTCITVGSGSLKKYPFTLVGITFEAFRGIVNGKLINNRVFSKSQKWYILYGVNMFGRFDFNEIILLLFKMQSILTLFGFYLQFNELLMKSELSTLSMYGFPVPSKKTVLSPSKLFWLYNLKKYSHLNTNVQTFSFSTHMYEAVQHATYVVPVETVFEANMEFYNFLGKIKQTSLEIYKNTSITYIWRFFLHKILYTRFHFLKNLSLVFDDSFVKNINFICSRRTVYLSYILSTPVKSFLGDFYQSRALFCFSGVLNACSQQIRMSCNTLCYFC